MGQRIFPVGGEDVKSIVLSLQNETDAVSLSVSERSLKKRDSSIWTSSEKFVVLGGQT